MQKFGIPYNKLNEDAEYEIIKEYNIDFIELPDTIKKLIDINNL